MQGTELQTIRQLQIYNLAVPPISMMVTVRLFRFLQPKSLTSASLLTFHPGRIVLRTPLLLMDWMGYKATYSSKIHIIHG